MADSETVRIQSVEKWYSARLRIADLGNNVYRDLRLTMASMNIATIPDPIVDLPKGLAPLVDLAYNLRWTWRRETQELFRQVDPVLWEANVSPVKILRGVRDWKDLESLPGFVESVASEKGNLAAYLADGEDSPLAHLNRQIEDRPVAYFCAEYALHTSMNQYAGGLGILAGDHCKEASDCRLPFIGIGLFYRRGFFHQMIDWSGRQEARYPTYPPVDLPIHRVADPATGEELNVSLEFPGRDVLAAVWLMRVGRTPLILLDTDLPTNNPEDRKITSQVYTNQREMRLYQETVLGIGGVRALRKLGIEAGCFHLNEGHSALLLLERMRELVVKGMGHEEALEAVRRTSVLTIHTPVPEGNERFDAALVASALKRFVAGSSLIESQLLKDGLGADKDPTVFDMTAFGLRHSSAANGVSLLHGRTADKTWSSVLGTSVVGITNGVHMPTWMGNEMRSLLERHGAKFDLCSEFEVNSEDRPSWRPALDLASDELWAAHLAQKRALIFWAQNRLFEQFARHGQGPSVLRKFADALDPDAFLIGFARRFATYKRAALLFSDLKRALSLLDGQGRKIQIMFAGKSHPSDRGGQAVIQQVFDLCQSSELAGKVFLLEDYDMESGAKLVQGADLWLNNPRRPLEASGTSGMKAAANGVPNLSILDGWWDEAFQPNPRNGWAIGDATVPADSRRQDRRDALALYKALEKEVVPCFFDRDPSGLPQRWIQIMRRSIADSLYSFSTVRMLRDYSQEMYIPKSQ
jgi:starch phosphorylase